jgi:hypothetical protein
MSAIQRITKVSCCTHAQRGGVCPPLRASSVLTRDTHFSPAHDIPSPSQQVTALRKANEDWFVLPDEDDEDVNYMNFAVELEAPVRAAARVGPSPVGFFCLRPREKCPLTRFPTQPRARRRPTS